MQIPRARYSSHIKGHWLSQQFSSSALLQYVVFNNSQPTAPGHLPHAERSLLHSHPSVLLIGTAIKLSETAEFKVQMKHDHHTLQVLQGYSNHVLCGWEHCWIKKLANAPWGCDNLLNYVSYNPISRNPFSQKINK